MLCTQDHEEELVQVDFVWTDDPYFFDRAHRCGTRATLSEEVQWEEETENGLTDQNFEDWLWARRESMDVAFLQPWDELRLQLEQTS